MQATKIKLLPGGNIYGVVDISMHVSVSSLLLLEPFLFISFIIQALIRRGGDIRRKQEALRPSAAAVVMRAETGRFNLSEVKVRLVCF